MFNLSPLFCKEASKSYNASDGIIVSSCNSNVCPNVYNVDVLKYSSKPSVFTKSSKIIHLRQSFHRFVQNSVSCWIVLCQIKCLT